MPPSDESRGAVGFGSLIIMSAVMLAQGASFEVATIRAAIPDPVGSSGEDGRNGLLKLYNVSLRRCIRYAYGTPEAQILGGPKWVDQLHYDITAKAGSPASEPELLKMLQPLLTERFKLAIRRETRSTSGYALTVNKGGIRARTSDPSGPSGANGGRGRLDVVGSPMSLLALRLSEVLGRPVVDRTNEPRNFDFHLKWTPDTAAAGIDATASDDPSLFTALEEQAGLKLVSQRVASEVLVVDHVELPSEN
jgi:uncharacterized protein (TIGR03435 family)